MTVTASAISGILNRAGFKRARRGSGWSSGFEVQQNFDSVSVCLNYSDTTPFGIEDLRKMADLLNEHGSGRYFVKISDEHNLHVIARDETDPAQNEARKAQAQEKLAADHPAAPAVADVKAALRHYSYYDADIYGFGYQVERLEEDSRLVRVRLVESPHATYETDRDTQISKTLACYARVILKAGFEFKVRDDEMSVIVAMPGEWDNVLTVETVETVLRTIYTPYSSKIGGFVVRLYGKDGGAVRVEHFDGLNQDEQRILDIVEGYGHLLVKTGYRVTVDFQDAWALLVTLAAPQPSEEAPRAQEADQDVREALLELREAVERHIAIVTRRAGDHSIFVIDGRGGLERVEVFYSDGEYKIKLGQGAWQRFPAVSSALLDLVRTELGC